MHLLSFFLFSYPPTSTNRQQKSFVHTFAHTNIHSNKNPYPSNPPYQYPTTPAFIHSIPTSLPQTVFHLVPHQIAKYQSRCPLLNTMTLTTTLIPLSASGASQATTNPLLHLSPASQATKNQATKNQATKSPAIKNPILHLSRASQATDNPISQLQLKSLNRSHGRRTTKTVRFSAQRISTRTTFATAFSYRGDNLQCYLLARASWSKIWSKNPFL